MAFDLKLPNVKLSKSKEKSAEVIIASVISLPLSNNTGGLTT
jgi:hypothetical protein